jgi:Tfp pilus assembly protein PilX
MKAEKGSALITVILVVLVLTMVGIAGLFFMTTEDRISGVDKMEKSALYAAEAGLRFGENIVSAGDATAMLSYAQTPYNIYAPPGGGYQAVVLTSVNVPAHTDLALQLSDPSSGGVDVPATEARGVQVPVAEGYAATYSIYVRNNGEDPSRSALADSDSIVDLVAVGTIATPTGQIIRKVVEEQLNANSTAGGANSSIGFGPQKGGNASGTGTATGHI